MEKAPVSALVTDVGKFVCLWVCSNFYSNVYKSVASASFSKSLKYRKKKKNPVWPCDAVLCLSVVQGEICRVPISQLSQQLPAAAVEAGLAVCCFMWLKERERF